MRNHPKIRSEPIDPSKSKFVLNWHHDCTVAMSDVVVCQRAAILQLHTTIHQLLLIWRDACLFLNLIQGTTRSCIQSWNTQSSSAQARTLKARAHKARRPKARAPKLSRSKCEHPKFEHQSSARNPNQAGLNEFKAAPDFSLPRQDTLSTKTEEALKLFVFIYFFIRIYDQSR